MRKPTIPQKDIMPDPRSDRIGQLLLQLSEYPSWTKERTALKMLAVQEMNAQNYRPFVSDQYKYWISTVGESYLYEVPKSKTGCLQPFRGKTVRIVCVGRGRHFITNYMVGVFMGNDQMTSRATTGSPP